MVERRADRRHRHGFVIDGARGGMDEWTSGQEERGVSFVCLASGFGDKRPRSPHVENCPPRGVE